MATPHDLGKKGEELAAGFLEAKGYNILDRNYRFKRAEVDLVALRLEPAELVFVEVKARSDTAFTYPEEAVDQAKRQAMFRAADSYIYEKKMMGIPVRFDIIAIGFDNPDHPLIHHIEDAFRMMGGTDMGFGETDIQF
ncbi:MAG: YraN family protein [Bacteroidetes bacterium]|nr:MAG: YraN family protein [Bacteroidota bacterium]